MEPSIILVLALLFSLWAVEVFVAIIVRIGTKQSVVSTLGSFILDVIAACLWALFYYLTH